MENFAKDSPNSALRKIWAFGPKITYDLWTKSRRAERWAWPLRGIFRRLVGLEIYREGPSQEYLSDDGHLWESVESFPLVGREGLKNSPEIVY